VDHGRFEKGLLDRLCCSGLGHNDCQGLGNGVVPGLQGLEVVAQVVHQGGSEVVDSRGAATLGGEELADLVDAGLVALAEVLGNVGLGPGWSWLGHQPLLSLEFLKVFEGELQDVGFLKFGDTLSLHLH